MRLIQFLLVMAVAGCTETPNEPASRVSRSQQLSEPSHAGYSHKLADSLFELGPNVKESVVVTTNVVAGDYGTFSTWPLGLTVALANKDAPALSRPLLTTDPDAHNARVRDYFVNGGLPEDQIATVNVHTTMSGGGPASEVDSSKPKLEWYTSVISRQIAGIPIFESVAWATFNADGKVVKEATFWPAVPTVIVQDALSLSAAVASEAYFTQSPAIPKEGRVVVHHTFGMGTKLSFVACFQTKPPPDMADSPCFDSAGAIVNVSLLVGGGS